MKIIDILVNIASNKEVPREIKYNNTVYLYYSIDKDYYKKGFGRNKKDSLFENLFNYIQTNVILNAEVEIIEEEKADIEQLDPFNYDEFKNMTPEERYKATIEEYYKINELVIAINKLKK